MPKSKFSEVKLKAYELTNASKNRKFVFLLFTECIFVNDGWEVKIFRVVIKTLSRKKSLYSAFF